MVAQSKLMSYECLGVVDDTTPELREELIRLLEMLGWDKWPIERGIFGIKEKLYPLPKTWCYNIFPDKGYVKRSTIETALRGGGAVPIKPITLEHFKWLVEDHLSGC